MGQTGRDVSEAELAVLQVLWQMGEVTRRQVVDVVYPGGGPTQYATVQKLLERLEEKGFVRRGGSEARRTFTALVNRDELIGRRLREVVDTLCGGSVSLLLSNLVSSRPLSAEELAQLRLFLRQQARQQRDDSQEAS